MRGRVQELNAMTEWEISEDSSPEADVPPPASRRETAHCLCGRFARTVGSRHYYNGHYDCYSYDVDCSRCGVVTIECV